MSASHDTEPAPGESSGIIKIPSMVKDTDPASLSGSRYRIDDEEVEDLTDLTERILGNYRLLRPLGGRGLCTVYEGRAVAGGDKRFAVKILRNANFKPEALPAVQRRFLHEAKIASRLHHPHICDVVDFGAADGLAYLVNEHLEGESLRQTLARHGPLPWTRVLPMFLHICDALEAAHSQGVIHRDLKPSNCFRVRHASGDDFIKVVDFGLARIVDEDLPEGLLANGVLLSTPEYMAPELIRGAKPDPRVDIYGVGVLLYELLTGACPFKNSKQTTVLAMQLLDTAIPPRRAAPEANIPSVVERVILKALSKAPEERYQNIMEMRVALLDDNRPVTKPSEPVARVRTPTAATRSLAALTPSKDGGVAMTVVLALVAAGLIGWVLSGTPGLGGPAPAPAPVAAPPPPTPPAPPPSAAPVEPPTEDEVAAPEVGDDPEPHAQKSPETVPAAAQPQASASKPTRAGKRPDKSSGTGPEEQVNFDIVEDPSAPTEVSPSQIDDLLRPYRPTASECGKQNGLSPGTDVAFKFMLAPDGRLTNIKPVGRASDDPAVQCMTALLRETRLEVPGRTKFSSAFFDYSFKVY